MSLEDVVQCAGLVPERHVAWIATSVLKGMLYLKTELSVIHRGIFGCQSSAMEHSCLDLKPANVLVNRAGQVKLCDLGVSGTLVHSLAMSFVGTQSYMSVSTRAGRESVPVPESISKTGRFWKRESDRPNVRFHTIAYMNNKTCRHFMEPDYFTLIIKQFFLNLVF